MKTQLHLILPAELLAGLVPFRSGAQAPAGWRDDLVDHLVGTWKMEGQIMGRDSHHEVEAAWMLNHQFLRIQEKTGPDAPDSEKWYEAIWFLGYDPVSERYLLHLLDVFGGRFSETLGYGTRDGNAIRFVFEYPDGPFRSSDQWSPEKDTWQRLMTQKGGGRKVEEFWRPEAHPPATVTGSAGSILATRPRSAAALFCGCPMSALIEPLAGGLLVERDEAKKLSFSNCPVAGGC